ncbi:hypothetical protein WJU23_14485 [Prosthecobacter sp. SYSU 5D2]|uniref:hypothetical protein n=1 Tax=Prosthecobacter sp. SYSU 5D2 TaxID=3134134 RepID=UPI0031FE9EE3
MAYVHLLKESFNGGEISPLLTARVSSPAHANGCAKLENFIPRVQGGVFKRPGLEYIGRPKGGDGAATRLFGFKRSTDINYMLEIGTEYIRIWSGGASPAIVPVTINTTPGTTVPDNANPWLGSASSGAWANSTSYAVDDQVTSSGTVFRCRRAHGSDPTTRPGTAAEHRWGRYWQEIPFYKVGDMVSSGGNAYYCTTRHYPSAVFATDAAFWRVMVDIPATTTAVYEIPTPYQMDELDDLKFCQLNDVLFIAHPNHPPARLTRRGENNWEFVPVPFSYAPALDVNETSTSLQVQFDGIPNFGLPWVAGTVYVEGDRVHGREGSSVANSVYECIDGHTASAAGTVGNEPGVGVSGTGSPWTDKWTLISASGYDPGDRVIAVDTTVSNPFNGQVFTCHTGYNPGSTANDEPGIGSAWQNYWNEGTSKVAYAVWKTNVDYEVGDFARDGKVVYECIRDHKSRAASAITGSGGRVGTQTVPGNRPGKGKGWVRFWRVARSDTDLEGLKFALFATEEVFTAEDVGTIWQLELGTGGIYESLTVPDSDRADTGNHPLFIQGGFTLETAWATSDSMEGALTLEESVDGVNWNVVKQWTIASKTELNISYAGESPSVGAWYRVAANALTPNAQTKIKLQAAESVYKLPFRITGYVEGTKVTGDLIMPNDRLPPGMAIGVSTTLWRKPAFSAENGYPSTVAFHESRLWWGGTAGHPTRIWGSHVDDFYIYLLGGLDTDGIDISLAAVEANQILWMTSFNRALVIGTSGDEWTVDGGETDEALKPSNIRARRRTRYGSSGLAPILTGDALLWVQRGGTRLREFTYVFQKDGYEAPDLTALAEHISAEGAFSVIALQSAPEPIVWATNGLYLFSFSYNREQQVTAWARHIVTGGVQGLGVMYSNDIACDEVWVATENQGLLRFNRRTMLTFFGPSKDLLNNDPTESCFVDLGSLVEGDGISFPLPENLTAYDAQSLRFWDGITAAVPTSIDYEEGTFTVDNFGVSPGWIGLPIISLMETSEIAFPLKNGTSYGRPMRLISVDLGLFKSLGGSVAVPVYDPLTYDVTQYQPILYDANNNQTFGNFSGKTGSQALGANYTRTLKVRVRSDDGAPFNLLSMVVKTEVEET